MENKTTLKSTVKSTFSLILIFILITGSCKKTETTNSEFSKAVPLSNLSNGNVPSSATARQIFKSIVFADGLYTAYLPTYSNNNIDITNNFSSQTGLDKFREMQDSIMDYIEANNSGYLASFKSDIMSGNVTTVKNRYLDAYNKLEEYMNVKLEPTGYTVDYFADHEMTQSIAEEISSLSNCVGPVLEVWLVVEIFLFISVHLAVSPPDPQIVAFVQNSYLVDALAADIVTNFGD
jgi:hypothetical protein